MNVAEFGENNRAYISDYIKFGDAKAAAVLTLTGLLCGALGSFAKDLVATIRASGGVMAMVGCLAAAVVCVSSFAVLWNVARAISPDRSASRDSLASYPDIAALSDSDHCSRVAGLEISSIGREYAVANGKLSKIAVAKFQSIANALLAFRLLLLGAWILLVLYGIAWLSV